MKKNTITPLQMVKYPKELSELLAQIEPVDFKVRAGIKGDAKAGLKHYVTISVDEIVETAIKNDWGLCTKNGNIYVFNGSYWQALGTDGFKAFLGDVALKMEVPVSDAKYYKFKDELYKQFLSVSTLSTPERGKSVLINLLNGTFEINGKERRLREPRQEDFITYQLPFKYDPEARCPMFMKYLLRVLPDTGCRKVLAEFLAYIFVNNLKLEKALILYGSGANGKSVLFEIVNAILGNENICSYSLQELTKPESYQRAELSDKLVNYASEISKNMNTTLFKLLVSNEPVGVRPIFSKPFTMRDYGCKLIFNCNELPSDVEQNDAFFRRLIIIPFEKTIPADEQNPNLAKQIIDSELSGVFNWILKGLGRLLEQERFTESKKVKAQIRKYRMESDTVAMFIDEDGYIPSVENHISLQDLYMEYSRFCHINGYRACSSRKMAERLRNSDFELVKKREGQVVYIENIDSRDESNGSDAKKRSKNF